jgi:hypothetical protein
VLRRVLVNKPSDAWQLKILFPSIRLALDGEPAYGRVVYSNFPFQPSSGAELFLEQALSGYNLDTHLGLLGFLRECGYMSKAKLDRFDNAGRGAVLDSKGNVVAPEGRFFRDADVLGMYFFCSTLRLSNRVFLGDEVEAEYVLSALESPLYERLREADSVGHGFFVEKVLRLMDSFYSQDLKFRARKQGRASGFERMQKILGSFNRIGFKSFKFSGKDEEDAFVFLCLYGL